MKETLSNISTKPHYAILDGLRGIAAIMVLWFHIFEAYATSRYDQIVNHGYLAVDFFFMLSGFVIAYAYDDRWKWLSVADFFKRRLIRLHPMVIFGAILGGALFFLQRHEFFKTDSVTWGALAFATFVTALLFPMSPTAEIRGLGEMFPLNGPTWSLFFEYIGNICYVLFLRKFSRKLLIVWVILMGISLANFSFFIEEGYLSVGWTMTFWGTIGGALRLLFSFSAGLLLARVFSPKPVKKAFWFGALALIIATAMPHIGGEQMAWANGIYELCCIMIIFPCVIYAGASQQQISPFTEKVCKFLGDISYPLYMVHYPFIYIYYGWVGRTKLPFSETIWGALAVVFGSILLAYVSLKIYDEPVRQYLTNRFLKKKN